MSKIFLTGITGLVGSSVAVSLLRQREDVSIVCMTRRNSVKTAAERVADVIRAQCEFDGCPEDAGKVLSRISAVGGDVVSMNPAEVAKLPEVQGVDIIFHCAADVNLGKDPTGKTFNINYNGTLKMIELAKLLKVKEFHYVSTAYVAGCLKGRAMEDRHPDYGHNNPYEQSKWQAENEVRSCGIPFTIYRPGIVTGRVSDGRIRKPLAVYRVFEFLATLKSHYCTKKHLNPNDYVNMHLHFLTNQSERVYFAPIDFVQKSITALIQRPACNRTYHLTGNSPISVEVINEAVCAVLRLSGVYISEEKKELSSDDKLMSRFLGDLFPYFSNNVIFDQTNIIEALGKDAVSWEFGLKEMQNMLRTYFRDFYPDVEWLQKLIAQQ